MRQDLNEIIEDFSLFEDWEERYRYLIDLGRTLPEMKENLKTDEHIVRGCTSRVWMVLRSKNGCCYFDADSDAQIVRGLIAILMKVYQGQEIEDIGSIDIEHFFFRLGLEQHLSPNRRNGFFSMVEKINSFQG